MAEQDYSIVPVSDVEEEEAEAKGGKLFKISDKRIIFEEHVYHSNAKPDHRQWRD